GAGAVGLVEPVPEEPVEVERLADVGGEHEPAVALGPRRVLDLAAGEFAEQVVPPTRLPLLVDRDRHVVASLGEEPDHGHVCGQRERRLGREKNPHARILALPSAVLSRRLLDYSRTGWRTRREYWGLCAACEGLR